MPKISLITLHSVQNYGSALQTYASQLYFEKLGYEVETVDYVRQNNLKENLVNTALRNSRVWNRNFLTRMVFSAVKAGNLKKRYDIFDNFIHKYIKLTEHRYLCDEDFEKHPIAADIYCTGSDQTWNTYWNRGFLLPYYLSYASEGAKKIAYAASFGKTELDEDEKEQTRELLSDYSYITVRELSGVDILSGLGIESSNILDPTLMLCRDDWMRLTEKPDIKGRYMLVYQLSHNSEFDRYASALAKEKGLKLIRIGFGKEAYLYGGRVILNPEVFEFLSLMANADYIITDSFHATSFAVNLNVNFFVWLPRAFTSRITDFLGIVGLQNRIFDCYDKLLGLYDESIDFDSVNKLLAEERERCGKIVEGMLSE